MSTGLKFLIILSMLASLIIVNHSLSDENSDVECAFSNSLCNPYLKRPCCNVKDVCQQIQPENVFKCTKKEGLGKLCYRDEECEDIQHAKCSKEKRCVCRAKNIQINEMTCGPLLGGFCWKNESCVTNNAVCIDSECQCDDDYSPRFDNQCVFSVLRGYCENDDICQQVNFAKCLENTCQCTSNTISVNPTHCAALIGGFCWTTNDCLPVNSHCVDNKCQCQDLYVPESDNKCTLAYIGMQCKHDLECSSLIPHAECSTSSTCTCESDYFPANVTVCVERSENNVYCIDNDSCALKNFVCIYHICQCKRNFVSRGSECLAGRLYESCSSNLDCDLIEHAVCSFDKMCVCDKNFGSWNEICKPVLGGSCSGDNDCIAVNSVCIDKKCRCKKNHLRQSENLCVPPRLGAWCMNHNDCATILNAKCSNNRCECISGYGQYNITACAPLLGGFCSENKLCAPINSFCTGSICLCREGYLSESNDQCSRYRLAMQCITDEHCERILGSRCINNACVCAYHHIIVDGTVCAPLLGKYCESNQRCAPENSICIDNKCQCMNGYKKHYNYRCVSETGLFKISCNRDDHCDYTKYAVCSNDKKCACKSNYVLLGEDECVALIGEYCDSDDECISYNTVCIDHKCQCTEKFVMRSKYQCDRISLGTICQKDHGCQVSIKNSICSEDNICVCQKNYYARNEYECIPSLDENCATNDDCRFNSSVCIDNKCQCEHNFRSVSASQCVQMSSLWNCKENLDCGDSWHNKCSRDKKCICNENNVSINKSTCLPHLDGYCWVDHQCIVQNSHCVDYRCKCKDNYKPVATNRCMPSNPIYK